MIQLPAIQRVMDTQRPWRMLFKVNRKVIGHMYITRHPTIPFEVYTADSQTSKRVHSEGAAELWLLEQVRQNVAIPHNRSPKKLARLKHALFSLQKPSSQTASHETA